MIFDPMDLIWALVIWFACGFIAFLIEVKRAGYYKDFDDAEHLFVGMMLMGILTLVCEIVLLAAEAFHDGMDKLIDKINKM